MCRKTDRRSFLSGLLVSAGSLLSGCLSPTGNTSTPTRAESPNATASPSQTSQTPSSTTTRQDGRTASGGLAINNNTTSTHEVSITVDEAPGSSPSYENPGTLTAETPVNTTTPLFRRNVVVEADRYKGFSDVFPEPDGPVTYHVFAQLDGGETTNYGFQNFPRSGFGYVSVFICSEAEIRITHAVA